MLKIKLSKNEKVLLRAIKNGDVLLPFSKESRRAVIDSLAQKNLVKPLATKDGISARLSDAGHLLFEENPKLRNPIDWNAVHDWVNSIVAIAAFILSLISLL